MPEQGRWRSSAAYRYINELDPAGIAWEFLRRNRDYQHEFEMMTRRLDHSVTDEKIAERWGLRFRDRSEEKRQRSRSRLDGGHRPDHGPAGADAGREHRRKHP